MTKLTRPFGFENDEIFLLSKEEWANHKKYIPSIKVAWWLRWGGGIKGTTDSLEVHRTLTEDTTHYSLSNGEGFVRPGLKIPPNSAKVGNRIIKYSFPWIVIGKDGLCIAEVPIAFETFDTNNCNNYEKSSIRQFLKNWVEAREA